MALFTDPFWQFIGSEKSFVKIFIILFILLICNFREQYGQAQILIDSARDLLDTELTALSGESYQRAYGAMVLVQMLAELEEVIQYKILPERRAPIRKMWWQRLQVFIFIILSLINTLTRNIFFSGMSENSRRLAKNHPSAFISNNARRRHENLVKIFISLSKIWSIGKTFIILNHKFRFFFLYFNIL
jgi:hypothetical protein